MLELMSLGMMVIMTRDFSALVTIRVIGRWFWQFNVPCLKVAGFGGGSSFSLVCHDNLPLLGGGGGGF
ncbi:hypothetical protein Nepgr_014295 [Nepenthes gracilis]|uniref:Uncharacterized protein n=1 Tax=Nepenthes gracilis TaxID=150966 RepID=A0AAD3SKL2_NEPGR|nr:hypothetical protein Nepgr_014295 [Nepenthes gracilis]